jgi:hypothetical protein
MTARIAHPTNQAAYTVGRADGGRGGEGRMVMMMMMAMAMAGKDSSQARAESRHADATSG